MAKAKRATKRIARMAALALGTAGASIGMTGSASATAPTNVPSQDDARWIFLGEEEITDVSLTTFHVFDRETEFQLRQGEKLAAGLQGGCGITRGCGPGGCVGASCAAVGGGSVPPMAAAVAALLPAVAALLPAVAVLVTAVAVLVTAVAALVTENINKTKRYRFTGLGRHPSSWRPRRMLSGACSPADPDH